MREKVKLAILRAILGRDLRIVDQAHDQSEEAADAVIAVVLEEAAKVAEHHFVGMFTGWRAYTSESKITLDEAEDAANECGPICGAAIRALNSKVQG